MKNVCMNTRRLIWLPKLSFPIIPRAKDLDPVSLDTSYERFSCLLVTREYHINFF